MNIIASARRTIAIGKASAFDLACALLQAAVARGELHKGDAIAALHDGALANDLTSIHGTGWVESKISGAFDGAVRQAGCNPAGETAKKPRIERVSVLVTDGRSPKSADTTGIADISRHSKIGRGNGEVTQ